MLYDIYGNADRVCIWLGEQSKSSRTALRFIKEDVLQLVNFDELITCQHASRKWFALMELMQRPWFSCRYAVWEIALAQIAVLYCGRDRIPWRRSAIAVGLIINAEPTTHWLSEALKKATPHDPDVRKAITTMKKTTIQPLLTLEYLVSKLATFETTVPYDTIYALLAIGTSQASLMDTPHPLDHSQPGSMLSFSWARYNIDYKAPYECVQRVHPILHQEYSTFRSIQSSQYYLPPLGD